MKNHNIASIDSVCSHCGAVNQTGSHYCAFCGAALVKENTTVQPRRDVVPPADASVSVHTNSIQPVSVVHAPSEAKKPFFTLLGVLSFLSGIFALCIMIFAALYSGFFAAVLAVIFGAVNLGRKRGGGLLSAIGLGLGIFVVVMQGFWSFMSIFYFL